jgi:hypothetical protein
MASVYNKLLFTSENTEPELINYYLTNDDKVHPYIKYLPKNAISQDIINTPIYQEIHTGYDPHAKSDKNLDVIDGNSNVNEYKTKSEILNVDSPDVIDCEVTVEDYYDSNKNIINDYKYYPKSPKCNKNYTSACVFNDHNDDDDIFLYSINEKQNKARSPKVLRKNYFNLDNDNNDNEIFAFNDINSNNNFMYKSNSLSKIYKRNPSPLPSTLMRNKNQRVLKDSYSTSNIRPMNNFQYQYNFGSYQNKNNNMSKKQISRSPQNYKYALLSNSIKDKTINSYGNNYSSSTKYSRSPNLNKTHYGENMLSENFKDYTRNSNIKSNDNYFYYMSPNINANLDNNYQYVIDNPVPNAFKSILNLPENNSNNNKSNINNIHTNSVYNYILKNGQSNNRYNNNLILTPSKIYKPKYPKSNIKNNQYIQKYALSHFPQKSNNNNVINLNNNPFSNSPKIVYQYNYQKSLSPKNIQYKSGNIIASNSINTKKNTKKIKNILNSTKYPRNIKSCLPKISNFSQNVSKKEFLSNNINDISFGDSNDMENNLQNNDNIFGISSHKNIKSDNLLLSSKNCKKYKNSKITGNENIKNAKNAKFSKKSTKKIPINSYSKYMFESINKIRANPQSFIQPLKEAINKIAYDKKKGLYYNGNLKVALCKGKIAFEEAISFLANAKPMKPLIYKKNLCVEISDRKKDFESGDYLRQKINDMVIKGISVRAFWRDIIKDPEINFLLMIVDDNYIRRGAKRKDILNPEMKYIGINSGNLGNNFVCYTVLSDE